MLAAALAAIDRLLLGQMVEPIRRDLGIDDMRMSVLLGVSFTAAFAAAVLPVARWVDRGQRRRILAWGIAGWSTMAAAGAFADNYAQLLVARAGVGLCEAALVPAAASLVADLFDKRRVPLATSLVALGYTVGTGLSFLIGGAVSHWSVQSTVQLPLPLPLPLAIRFHGWQFAMLVVGLPGLLLAAAVARIAEPARGHRLEQHPDTRGLLRFVRERRALGWPLALGLVASHTGSNALVAWISTYFVRVQEQPLQRVGPLLGAVMLGCSSAGVVLGGWAASRLLARRHQDATVRVGAAATVVAMPFFVAAPLVGSPGLALALLVPAVLFGSMKTTVGVATVQLVAPNEYRGQLSALLMLSTHMVGAMLGPTLVAACTTYLFKDPMSLGAALSLVCGLSSALSGLAFAAAMRPLRREMARHAA